MVGLTSAIAESTVCSPATGTCPIGSTQSAGVSCRAIHLSDFLENSWPLISEFTEQREPASTRRVNKNVLQTERHFFTAGHLEVWHTRTLGASSSNVYLQWVNQRLPEFDLSCSQLVSAQDCGHVRDLNLAHSTSARRHNQNARPWDNHSRQSATNQFTPLCAFHLLPWIPSSSSQCRWFPSPN